jgi:drug/metabolite transporter (DMT)-like permease
VDIALALALYVGLAFACHDALAKTRRPSVPPEAVTMGSLVWGFPLIALSALALGAGAPSLRAASYYALAGVLNFAVGRSLLYVAIDRLGSSGGSVMSSTSAVFGVVAGWALAGEDVGARVVAGAAMIFLAAYLASGGLERIDLVGLAAGLGNGLGIASGIVLARLGNISGGNPVAGVAIAYTVGALVAGIASTRHGHGNIPRSIKSPVVAALGLLAASGQVARYQALTSLGASIVAPLQNTRPLLATTILALLGAPHVKPGKKHWVASILVIAGVYLVASQA